MEIYHDHYFEGRTFGYILDDSIPAGGTTIDFRDVLAQRQPILQQGHQTTSSRSATPGRRRSQHPRLEDLRWRRRQCLRDERRRRFEQRAALWLRVGSQCGPTLRYEEVHRSPSRATTAKGRAIQMGDCSCRSNSGMFLALATRNEGGMGPPVDTSHVRNITPLPAGCTLNGRASTTTPATPRPTTTPDSFRYVVG